MSDYLSDLQRMVNQIADYFTGYPQQEAVAGIAEHLQKFWNPQMRQELAAAVASGQIEVSEVVREAVNNLA